VTRWDFFVSYTQSDRGWAEWIAWQLEAAGYSVLFQGWDFVPGANWIRLMQDGVARSARLIAVLSPEYVRSVFAAAEWQAIWADDPTGARRRVIPVRVADCARPGLLAGVLGIDVFGVPEPTAAQRLQDAVARALAGRAKPVTAPAFPGRTADDRAGQALTGTQAGADAGPPVVEPPSPHYARTPARRPQFPDRKYHVDLRGARGVQIGDGNTQYNQW
jgi:hypothetical protein